MFYENSSRPVFRFNSGGSVRRRQCSIIREFRFNVWSQKKKVENLQYMHMNPVKRKLVDHSKDCLWNGFSLSSIRTNSHRPRQPRNYLTERIGKTLGWLETLVMCT